MGHYDRLKLGVLSLAICLALVLQVSGQG